MPKLVMTQVPCPGLTPRSPEMAGIETLAIEESSTFMNVARDKDSVPSSSAVPNKGGIAPGACVGWLTRLSALGVLSVWQ